MINHNARIRELENELAGYKKIVDQYESLPEDVEDAICDIWQKGKNLSAPEKWEIVAENFENLVRKQAISLLEMMELLSMACAVAEAGFNTDYGFNHEASVEPRRIIAKIRAAIKAKA